MKNIELSVKGMMCSGCENRVKTALLKVKGVKSVDADHIKGVVTLEAGDNVKEDIIKEQIEALGFDVL